MKYLLKTLLFTLLFSGQALAAVPFWMPPMASTFTAYGTGYMSGLFKVYPSTSTAAASPAITLNGTTGNVSATSFSGNLTGNASGSASSITGVLASTQVAPGALNAVTSFTASSATINGNISVSNESGIGWGNRAAQFVGKDNTSSDSYLRFDTTNAERMRIDKDGNVGIGTTSPYAALLDVRGNIATSGQVISSGTSINYFAGSVGVGTNTPSYILDVQKNANPQLRIGDTDTTPSGNVGDYLTSFWSVDSSSLQDGSRIRTIPTGDWQTQVAEDADLVFYTRGDGNTSEQVRVTSSGNVGIGTTSPSKKLEVAGAVQISSAVLNVSGSGAGITTTGDVTAAFYHGDGSALTGLPGGGDVLYAASGTFTGQNTFTNMVTISSAVTISSLSITGNVRCFAYKTDTQNITAANAWQNISFSSQTFTRNISYSASTFTVTGSGVHKITYFVRALFTANRTPLTCRLLKSGVEIMGSYGQGFSGIDGANVGNAIGMAMDEFGINDTLVLQCTVPVVQGSNIIRWYDDVNLANPVTFTSAHLIIEPVY